MNETIPIYFVEGEFTFYKTSIIASIIKNTLNLEFILIQGIVLVRMSSNFGKLMELDS